MNPIATDTNAVIVIGVEDATGTLDLRCAELGTYTELRNMVVAGLPVPGRILFGKDGDGEMRDIWREVKCWHGSTGSIKKLVEEAHTQIAAYLSVHKGDES